MNIGHIPRSLLIESAKFIHDLKKVTLKNNY
jgi:hypothetical protein